MTGFAFSSGLSALWIAVGCVAGITTSWLWLAREFRRERDRYGVLTLPDYLAAKYPERSRLIRWISSLIILFFFLFYVSAQFSGSGKTLEVTFGLDPAWGILVSATVVILYSMAGGFFSVVWTDAVQAILMILSLGLLPILALFAVRGQGISIGGALAAAGGGRDSWAGGLAGFSLGLMVVNNLAWFFGYLGGQPQLSSRWMAMRNDADVRTGAWIAIAWTLVAYSGAILIGLTGLALYGAGAVDDPEKIFPYMVNRMLPPWLGGIMLTGAVAAMMSTASSQLLISASCFGEDILHRSLGRRYPERTLVRISRATVAAAGLLGLLLAFGAKELIYYVVGWAWAGIGCSFSPEILLAFFWRRFHANGVVA
ncbi:MAG: sodium/proline symporter, partial [Candidatus Eisenbacteria bacterium]|nr:sodium/proline symporter [Candidatus Eisenbacteria bacterium]